MSSSSPAVLTLAAFSTSTEGGNPAGVVLDARGLDRDSMQRTAAEAGFSETAFVIPAGDRRFAMRFFAPAAEVAFCGHATIAAAVALGERQGPGEFVFETAAGVVPVLVEHDDDGRLRATLLSVSTSVAPLDDSLLDELLLILGWSRSDVHPAATPMVAFAGNHHPVLVARSTDRLESLDYDFEALRALCTEHIWPTIQLVAPMENGEWLSRNPFAFGGVYEDSATGSAAAALGAYLRELGTVVPGDVFVVLQGVHMGRPSEILVSVGESRVGVTGYATQVD
ncbi:PhzF family phenazine biosynthesis protein [Microbacteriaceae bacterium MWH-Ta3]|nr:PhzF family phenazine biosynthesis protein [Microbacteriaceae bacterium MWH-Ta3]